jgi:hypothetical protein
MTTKLTLTLAQAARKTGGDKYETDIEGETRPMSIYIPQSISRAGGTPATKLDLTIEPK